MSEDSDYYRDCGTADDRYWIPSAPTRITADATFADHPHTDPGDGRTECQRCGKHIWPAIHSCKGIPVTDRARARAATSPAGGPSDAV